MIKYKKVPNNENVIEVDGKVILSFDPKYKEYLKWRDENPDLEQQLIDDLEKDIKNKELYNNGSPHTGSNDWTWYNEDGNIVLEQEMDDDRDYKSEGVIALHFYQFFQPWSKHNLRFYPIWKEYNDRF